uniref:MyoD family inhibitor domain-containing protein n=1 Tax=Gouania willdenowi TaxID=441366 RepID=A0A8C5HYP4_GOUWI
MSATNLFMGNALPAPANSMYMAASHNLCVSLSVDCAGMVLNCLFCQFCDLFHMLPDSCARLVNHCCPNYKHIITTIESTPSNEDDVCDLDCGLFSCCHDAGDCLELAMEVSQLCYH